MPLPTIPPSDAAVELLNRRHSRRSMNGFVHYTFPGVDDAWYHPIVDSYLDSFIEGRVKRLMILMPPRHGKSERVSRRLPAKLLGNYPDAEIIACSHSMNLIARMSSDVKRVIDSPEYHRLFPDTRLPSRSSGDRNTTDFWQVAGRLGSYRAAGVGGGITGQGFKYGIIDDITKGFEQASSQTWRDKIWGWYGSDFYTRQAPGAGILITATPWDRDDLMGRLQALQVTDANADKWEIVRLPAFSEETRPHYDLRDKPGVPLWESRFGETFLNGMRATLGTQMFTALYQCRPDAASGNRFAEHWFGRYDDGGEAWLVRGTPFMKKDITIFMTVDPASSEKKSADHTAIGVYGITPKNDLLILDMINEQMGVDQIGKRMKLIADEWKPSFAIFEVNGFQSAVAKEAQQIPGMPPLDHVLAHHSKLVRATPAIIAAENGQIHLPRQGAGDKPLPWVRKFIQQALSFRGVGDEDDDMIDTLSYAILRKNLMGQRKEVAPVGLPAPIIEFEQPTMPDDWRIGLSRFLPM